MSIHQITSFAKGHYAWGGLDKKERLSQFEKMIEDVESLYPRYKVYLYDDLNYYTLPFTIFGRKIVAMWPSNGYLIYKSNEFVDMFVGVFNRIIKFAEYYPHEFTGYIQKLVKENF